MDKRVLLCIDSDARSMASSAGCRRDTRECPSCVLVESRAEQCRARAKLSPDIDEVWVVSCDDMDAINVAAAIKRDDPGKRVHLVAAEQNGSLASRAANAEIDELWSGAMLAKRYESVVASDALRHRVEQERPKAPVRDVPQSTERGPLSTREAVRSFGDESRRDLAASGVHSCVADDDAALTSRLSVESDVEGFEFGRGIETVASPGIQTICSSLQGANRSDEGGISTQSCAGGAFSGGAPISQSSCRQDGERDCKGLDIVVRPTFSIPGDPTVEGPGTVVAVVSGTGGCGKSTLAAVFALLGARAGLRTAVFDADFQFGDLDYLLGVPNPLRVEEAIDNPSRLASAASSAGDAPFLVAAPRRIEVSELVTDAAAVLTAALRRSFDLVVVNTGSLWSDGHAGILESADAVVFLMDSRPSSLRATVHAVELCARLGVATTGFTFAVNRHDKASLLSAVDVSCALRGARAVELADGGKEVDELLGAGYPEELVGSKNAFVADARGLLAEILPERRADAVRGKADASKRRRSLFGRGGRR